MSIGTCNPCLSVWDWSELSNWEKKKNYGFWKNCGFKNIRDYVGKRKINLWFEQIVYFM